MTLPPDWEMVRFRDLGTWYGGATPSKSRPEFWADGDVPWLSPKDMGPDVLRSTRDFITSAGVDGSPVRLVPSGSIAVVVRSGILERTIPVGLVPFAPTLNQDMKAVTPRRNISAKWIGWGLRSMERHLLDHARKAGTTVSSIEMHRFFSQYLPVPPLGEQLRIVEILESHLSRLDAALETLRAVATRLRPLVSALLQQIVPTGEVRGWRLATVGEAGQVQLGRQRHPDWHTGPEMKPYLRVANVFEDRIDARDVMEMDFSGVSSAIGLSPGMCCSTRGRALSSWGDLQSIAASPPKLRSPTV